MNKINGEGVRSKVVETRDRRRSLSSVSGYLEDPSREYSFTSGQLQRSSSLSVLPEEKETSGYKGGWSIPWRWSRMRKSYRRKTIKRSTDRHTKALTSSEDYSREEVINAIVKGQNGEHYLSSSSSISVKYQPRAFEEIVGNGVVVKAIYGSIKRNKAARIYLFNGSSGTGKTSMARVFAAALNCESRPEMKPCWRCQACSRSLYVLEMCSGSRLSGFEKAKTLIESTSFAQAVPGFKVFIVEECHLLTMEAWDELLAMVEEAQNQAVIFVLITTESGLLPTKVLSRCQKYCFSKLKDADIKVKLEKIAAHEGIGLEEEALQLIVAKADGSLREAESILDQLTLLGRSITTSMAQQIVCLIPRDKLQDLLDAALSGDAVKTVKITTEHMGMGVDPQTIMSQLATLIKHHLSNAAVSGSESSSTALTKVDRDENGSYFTKSQSEKLCLALKVLVGVEKQGKSFVDQSTQVFAALLEIASLDVPPRDFTLPAVHIDDPSSEAADINWHRQTERKISTNNIHDEETSCKNTIMNTNEENRSLRGKAVEREPTVTSIEEIWLNILERIQNWHMKEFLFNQVKLASLTISSANAIVHLMFNKPEDKQRAQMSEESISRALQSAIGHPVILNMSLKPLDLRMIGHNPDSTFKNGNSPSRKQQRAQENLQIATISVSKPNFQKEKKISISAKQGLHLAVLSSQEKQPNGSAYQEINGPSPGIDHVIRIQKPKAKHRGLSLSSIPQSDASVEPYSQDILFEHTNKDRESTARKNSRLQKGSSKAQKDKYPHVDAKSKGHNRPWSCKEIFCQDNMGREHQD